MAPFWSGIADTTRGMSNWQLKTYTKMRINSCYQPCFAAGKTNHELRRMASYRFGGKIPAQTIIEKALESGPYGRCVYHCDNNVVDHQVVMMQMEDDATVTFNHAGSFHYEHRSTRIEGSHGRLMAEFGNGGSRIVIDEHRTDWHMEYDTSANLSDGHGGGDFHLI